MKLKETIASKGMSYAEFARKAQITPLTLNRVDEGKRTFRSTAVRILETLRSIGVFSTFEEMGIKIEERTNNEGDN